jgi:hypothetical protein
MTSRILASLGTVALPSIAWAHSGHVADLGQGHDHWMVYWLGAGLVVGLVVWAGTRLTARARKVRRRT